MNILIYDDEGVSRKCLDATVSTLRQLLYPHYAVSTINSKQIINEPWQKTAVLLIIPGGRDVPYCNRLNGAGNSRIKEYVRRGGRYLGLCAGAYYACRKVEFELDTPIAVEGSRELGFYNHTARGCAFSGFEYNSEAGARAVTLTTSLGQLKCYYNGGGIFVDTERSQDTVVIAKYDEMPVQGQAAVIQTKFGEGLAILSAVHPEIGHSSFTDLRPNEEVLAELKRYDIERLLFLQDLLQRLGLRTNQGQAVKLSALYLITASDEQHQHMTMLLQSLSKNGMIVTENDTFRLTPQADVDTGSAINLCVSSFYPSFPLFDISKYLSFLKSKLGSILFYGETVTSSQTLLDKNFSLQKSLPSGLIILASRQTQGRGRGSNAWVSPPGVLSFSMLLHSTSDHIIFIQYLISLSVVEAIKALRQVDIKMKWPNDIYIASPNGIDINGKKYAKLSGSLITTTYWDGKYILVIGVGINVSNEHPTVCLNSVCEPLGMEELLAKIMSTFERNFEVFSDLGFKPFMDRYHANWLHTNQRITIDETGQSGIISNIHPEHGTLVVKMDNGQFVNLSSDGNSFDMLRNLILVKR